MEVVFLSSSLDEARLADFKAWQCLRWWLWMIWGTKMMVRMFNMRRPMQIATNTPLMMLDCMARVELTTSEIAAVRVLMYVRRERVSAKAKFVWGSIVWLIFDLFGDNLRVEVFEGVRGNI